MRMPNFIPSKHFIEDDPADECFPCLVATVRNSSFPVVGKGFVNEKDIYAECVIRIRGRNTNRRGSARPSAWQQDMLHRLLDNSGLAKAIQEALADYETKIKRYWQEYDAIDERERAVLRRRGLIAFVIVREIIIDEIQGEVMIRLSTDMDGYLAEHGAVVYRRRGKWHLDHEDYLINYHSRIHNESPALKKAYQERLEKESVAETVTDEAWAWANEFMTASPREQKRLLSEWGKMPKVKSKHSKSKGKEVNSKGKHERHSAAL